MKYCSIDIETCGLDPETCDVLEIGAVIDDWFDPKPLDQLPKFHCYISQKSYRGQPFALGMHAEIFKRISVEKQPHKYYTDFGTVCALKEFLALKFGDEKISVAGKNFSSFDLNFLKKMPYFDTIKLHHRVFDPSSLYFELGDKELPSSKLCMERAGMQGEVAHTAVEDAMMVVKLLRKHYKIGE